APIALEGPGVGVEHDDTVVAVAVGDEQLVRFLVDLHGRRLAELGGVVAASARAGHADRQQQLLAVVAEFVDGAVVLGVAGDPDRAGAIDEQAVLVDHPRLGVGEAPSLDEVALGVELHGRRGRDQHVLRGGLSDAPFSSSVSLRGHCSTQTWSWESTATLATCPNSQLLGNSLGHDASIWNCGTVWA